MASAITTSPLTGLEEPTCITPKSSGKIGEGPHSFGTPAPHRGFLFRESPEGSLHDLADKAQGLFTQALQLLETDLPTAQRTFSEAQKLLPRISEVMPKEHSGSDAAILSAVQSKAIEVAALMKRALAAEGH